MDNLFDGLESLGIKNLEKVKLFEEEKKVTDDNKEEKQKERAIVEADLLFDKTYKCPVCDKEFKSKSVKTGKPRLIGSDTDLRPRYAGIDSIKYDAIVCTNCGYATLSRFFGPLIPTQVKLVKENVSRTFTGLPEGGDIYTYDEALNRHKLVLYNTIIKKGKNSEKAYSCLKIAWIYRGMRESLPEEDKKTAELSAQYQKNENDMLSNAFEGFIAARAKEDFPICGMDEMTFDYLLADIASRIGKFDVSLKLATGIIISRNANAKIKEKARTLRDSVKSLTSNGEIK